MELNQTYEDAPRTFCKCFASDCTACTKCLRYICHQHLNTQDENFLYISSHLIKPEKGTDCPYFRPDKKVRLACGFLEALDKMPAKISRNIRTELRQKYGSSNFYRYMNGQIPLDNKQQMDFIDDFLTLGATFPIEFDSYIEIYNW